MQRTEQIEFQKILDIANSIFKESAIAYEDYSKYDSELEEFDSKEDLIRHIENVKDNGDHSANYAIYYPAAKGYFFKEKIKLNPEKCDGATFRYRPNGWGLIHLQVDLRETTKPEVSITVNSEKRATAWEPTCPELKESNLWDWKYIEKQAGRLIRVLKKSSK